MSSLGIYFGPKIISIAETKGKKLINNTSILQSTISQGELEEKVPAEVKISEITALFKDELRRNRITAKEANLSLSGRDLILRTFEIPKLPKEELASAINFEAKKYIPFKVEDLISDFQLKFDKISHTNLVLFIGIKKETLDRYISILSQSDIRVNAIEYSAFSILRCLKLAGLSYNGIVGVLSADLQGKDEVNFTVLEQGFPLFSRDIALGEGPESLMRAEASTPAQSIEKLKTEVRVSLDYFHRKFPAKNIKKTFLVFNEEFRPDLEVFMKEIGLSPHFVDITKHIDKTLPYSLNFVKAYSSSIYKSIRINLTVNLLASREKLKAIKQAAQKGKFTLSQYISNLDYRLLALGLIFCAATYGLGFYRMQTLRSELAKVLSLRTPVTIADPKATYEELTSKFSLYKTKLNNLDTAVKKQLYLTALLNIIPQAVPEGVWLTNMSLNKRGADSVEFILEGMSYLNDSVQEFNTVNQFLSNLKQSPEFNKYFSQANISSLERRPRDKSTVTSFMISCIKREDKKAALKEDTQ